MSNATEPCFEATSTALPVRSERGAAVMTLRLVAVLVVVFSAGVVQASGLMDYRVLYQQTADAVVLIHGQSGDRAARGTGAIVRPDGLVVTNAHVILDEQTGQPYDRLVVYTRPERTTGNNSKDLVHPHSCELITADPELDLALLRIFPSEAGETLDYLLLGDSDSVPIGEPTMAIGHPERGAFWTLTTGQIGAVIEDFSGIPGKHVFQMETSVNRGNSGGPLIDGNGQMIGVNSMIARQSEDGLAITGVNFAIRSGVVRDFVVRSGQSLDQEVEQPEDQGAPAPAAVVRAPSPPVVQPQFGAGETLTEAATVATRSQASARAASSPEPDLLVQAPPAARGFRSDVAVGSVLSGRELLSSRADAAFDDLDAAMKSLDEQKARSAAYRQDQESRKTPDGSLLLISAAESRLANPAPNALGGPGDGGTSRISSTSGASPGILVHKPGLTGTFPRPVEIDVEFKPSPGAKVELNGLKVVYVKLFDLDITGRLRPYLTTSGLKVDSADLPAGKHTLRIDMKDTSGLATSTTIRVKIE